MSLTDAVILIAVAAFFYSRGHKTSCRWHFVQGYMTRMEEEREAREIWDEQPDHVREFFEAQREAGREGRQ